MSKDERKEMIENIAERFTQMDDVDKSYIAGYMAGKAGGTSEVGAAGKDSGCNSMRRARWNDWRKMQ